MDQRAINAYQKNAIMTASKAELTLMLYDGAIKFCNIALSGFEKKEYEKINTNLKKAQAIITEYALRWITSIRYGKILREFMIIFTAA